jgi:hypothetical protein
MIKHVIVMFSLEADPSNHQSTNQITFFNETLLFVWRGVMVYICIMHDQFQSLIDAHS